MIVVVCRAQILVCRAQILGLLGLCCFYVLEKAITISETAARTSLPIRQIHFQKIQQLS
jgi:phage-related holin